MVDKGVKSTSNFKIMPKLTTKLKRYYIWILQDAFTGTLNMRTLPDAAEPL